MSTRTILILASTMVFCVICSHAKSVTSKVERSLKSPAALSGFYEKKVFFVMPHTPKVRCSDDEPSTGAQCHCYSNGVGVQLCKRAPGHIYCDNTADCYKGAPHLTSGSVGNLGLNLPSSITFMF